MCGNASIPACRGALIWSEINYWRRASCCPLDLLLRCQFLCMIHSLVTNYCFDIWIRIYKDNFYQSSLKTIMIKPSSWLKTTPLHQLSLTSNIYRSKMTQYCQITITYDGNSEPPKHTILGISICLRQLPVIVRTEVPVVTPHVHSCRHGQSWRPWRREYSVTDWPSRDAGKYTATCWKPPSSHSCSIAQGWGRAGGSQSAEERAGTPVLGRQNPWYCAWSKSNDNVHHHYNHHHNHHNHHHHTHTRFVEEPNTH